MRSTRVVIADDSPFVCRLLASYLRAAGLEVVATAGNGRSAVALARQHRPDVLTLDLEMPGLDGLAALEILMREAPTPVVVVSGVSGRAASRTLEALEAGAVDFVLKYEPGAGTNPESLRREVVAKVEAAAKIRVIRSLPQKSAARERPPELSPPAPGQGRVVEFPEPAARESLIDRLLPGGLVVIGASTGGPLALRQLLSTLPADFPAAVVIVQHMPAAFTGVLAAQLHRQIRLPTAEARDGARLEAGHVLVAPGGKHLLLTTDARVHLTDGPEIHGHCPSIDVTMQSAAGRFGARAVGVQLTGMGSDGAQGILAIHLKGGRTFAQDAASAVVPGMPERAIETGAVDAVAPPAELGRLLELELGARRRRQRAC